MAKVIYEWTLETINEEGSIEDSDFSEKLTFNKEDLAGNDLGLVRRMGSDEDGEIDRVWAYVKHGKLPEFFSDAHQNQTSIKVPVRFIKELNKFISQ